MKSTSETPFALSTLPQSNNTAQKQEFSHPFGPKLRCDSRLKRCQAASRTGSSAALHFPACSCNCWQHRIAREDERALWRGYPHDNGAIIPLPLHCAINICFIMISCIDNEPVPSDRAATEVCFRIHCIFVSHAPTINQFGSILSVKTTGIVSHLSNAWMYGAPSIRLKRSICVRDSPGKMTFHVSRKKRRRGLFLTPFTQREAKWVNLRHLSGTCHHISLGFPFSRR